MANHARGPALLPAPRPHVHRHVHDDSHVHNHNGHHVHSHDDLRRRQFDDIESVVTEVVQTVSVVQVLDPDGAVVDAETVFSPPASQQDDPPAVVTLIPSYPSDALPEPSAPVSVPIDTPLPSATDSPLDSAYSVEATPLTSAPYSPSSFYSSSVLNTSSS